MPGAIFQSILVGGGYGTGREVVEYFTRLGPAAGLLAIGVAFCIFVLVLGLTFDLARRLSAYDYRALFKILLGRGWFLYEVVGLCMMMITFAVLISAASGVLDDGFGLPASFGIAAVFLLVGALEFFGRETVMRVLTLWSIVLYGVFVTFLVQVYAAVPDSISEALTTTQVNEGWAQSGFLYAMYNITAVPIILYVTRDFETRQHSWGAAVIAAVIAVVPAIIFHIAFSTSYPEIGEQDIPVYWMMNLYGMSLLTIAFTIMLFGTLVETGAGVLQGVNERIDGYLTERGSQPLGRWGHSAVALGFMAMSVAVASFGIKDLIDKGYGTMALAFLAIYFIPLVTVGVFRLVRTEP
jgi:uncharacterized membrane protein YkvI